MTVWSKNLFAAVFVVFVSASVGCATNQSLPPAGPPVSRESPVRVYGARWCRHTRAVLAWFHARGIAVLFNDVENNQDAMTEMVRRATAAGLRPRAIPLVDVRGRLSSGFHPDFFERALED